MMTTQEVLVGFGIWRLCLIPLLLITGLGLYCSTHSLEPDNEPASHGSGLSASGVKVWFILLGALAVSATICWWLKWQAGPPADLGWTRWPYLDKRWLVAAYVSGIAGFIVLPSLVLRTTTRPGMQKTGTAPLPWVSVGARAGFGILLGSILFGPPWNTDASTRFIDLHEQIHWSGLQAIAHGHTPFLGVASFNYGPGMQLANYVYLKTTGQFTIPGFRETFGLSLWVTVSVIYAMLFAWLRFVPAVVCAVLTACHLMRVR